MAASPAQACARRLHHGVGALGALVVALGCAASDLGGEDHRIEADSSPPRDQAALLVVPVRASVSQDVGAQGDARALAEEGGDPLSIALAVVGPFEGRTQEIRVDLDRTESPTRASVTIVRDGLLDDALRSERWDIMIERTAAFRWGLHGIARSWRCRRDAQHDDFDTLACR